MKSIENTHQMTRAMKMVAALSVMCVGFAHSESVYCSSDGYVAVMIPGVKAAADGIYEANVEVTRFGASGIKKHLAKVQFKPRRPVKPNYDALAQVFQGMRCTPQNVEIFASETLFLIGAKNASKGAKEKPLPKSVPADGYIQYLGALDCSSGVIPEKETLASSDGRHAYDLEITQDAAGQWMVGELVQRDLLNKQLSRTPLFKYSAERCMGREIQGMGR